MALVLVVDDTATFRKALSQILILGGHEVVQAASGPDALALLESVRPDLIFLDISMPGLDGFGVLEAITERSAGRIPPVVMLTAHSNPKYLARAKALGAADLLIKTRLDIDDLLRRVTRHAESAIVR